MHILVIGFNHKTASIAMRERFAFSPDRLSLARRQLRQMKSIMECVIVNTCNRMELYLVCDQFHTGKYYGVSFLADWFGVSRESFQDKLYYKQNRAAIQHLLKVVTGLDSLVLGETQILGQVKQFFLEAQQQGTTGTLFNRLFQQAITFGKKVHADTELGQHPVSVSYAAVELAKKMFASLTGKKILLLGAGKMGELTAKHFSAAESAQVWVVNRTFEKAKALANRFAGQAVPWEQLDVCLQQADVVVSSTGAHEPVITMEKHGELLSRRSTPLFLIDIAVPRDIDPAVHQLENLFLYNIDDLEAIVDVHQKLRQREAEQITAWIEDEVGAYLQWVQTLGVIPLIQALREKTLQAQDEVMRSIERKLPDLTEQEKRVIRKHTKSLVNQFLRDPITRVKELAADSEREEALHLFAHLFALDETVGNTEEDTKPSSLSLQQIDQLLSSS